MLCGIVLTHAGGSMRVASSRAATAAALLAGLVVAGRLLPTAPGTRHPTTTSTTATLATVTAPPTAPAIRVPDAFGQTLAQATAAMRAAGLQGAATDRDTQDPTAVVVAQEPPAGELVPPDSVVGFRTRTDVQPNATPRRLRLGQGRTTAAFLVVAPDPPHHQLTVRVAMPRATDAEVWLETEFGRRVPVLASAHPSAACKASGGQARCVVRLGAINAGGELGIWTARVAKHSSLPAAFEVSVTFSPL